MERSVRPLRRGEVLRSKVVWSSLALMATFVLIAALAPHIAPHDPYRWDPKLASLAPAWQEPAPAPGAPVYLLGTDRYGRDVLSRLIYGTRTALVLAFVAVPLAAVIGTTAGLIAGYKGGRVDAAIRLVIDIFQALPAIMFVVMIVLVFRGILTASWLHGLMTLVIGYVLVSWAGLARLVRVSVQQTKTQLFVEAAISTGARGRRIILRHLLPNVSHIIWVWMINNVPAIILLEALLGYVGVGLTAAVDGSEFTAVSWGGLFYSSRAALRSNPLMLLLPALGVLLISMSFILVADVLSGQTGSHEG